KSLRGIRTSDVQSPVFTSVVEPTWNPFTYNDDDLYVGSGTEVESDMANFKAANVVPREYTWQQKKKFIRDARQYWWDDPYLYKEGSDGIMRRCASGAEAGNIMWHCHSSDYGGHHSNISKRNEMPQKGILEVEPFDCWGIDFMGPFPPSDNKLYILAYDNAAIYKEKTKRFHDKKLRPQEFEPGRQALMYNSRFKFTAGKLRSKWTGPLIITKVSPYGVVELFYPKTSSTFQARDVKHALNGRQPIIITKIQKYFIFRERNAEFDQVNITEENNSAAIVPR
ncbi:hypothetical protein A2U01_0006756, partial [Trifolium medium]|nr:hypothetical protein [Trifolium medium]